jgi:hypothetical protein
MNQFYRNMPKFKNHTPQIFQSLQSFFGKFRKSDHSLSTQTMLRIAEKQNVLESSDNLIGALMMRGDLDILAEVLDNNFQHFREIFVLDGTEDWGASKIILEKYPNIHCILHDQDLSPEYNLPPRDGARQVLLDAIQQKYGYDGYIVVLHSDEMFYDYPPSLLAAAMKVYSIEAMAVRNVHFFLHSSMAGSYSYDPEKSVVDQVCFACFPGYPEMRIFKNKPGLYYEKNQHGRVIPHGLENSVQTNFPIRHYLYRSPEQMQSNAADRGTRGWQTYGKEWMGQSDNRFVDCLPGYKFSKFIPKDKIILDGEKCKLEER